MILIESILYRNFESENSKPASILTLELGYQPTKDKTYYFLTLTHIIFRLYYSKRIAQFLENYRNFYRS